MSTPSTSFTSSTLSARINLPGLDGLFHEEYNDQYQGMLETIEASDAQQIIKDVALKLSTYHHQILIYIRDDSTICLCYGWYSGEISPRTNMYADADSAVMKIRFVDDARYFTLGDRKIAYGRTGDKTRDMFVDRKIHITATNVCEVAEYIISAFQIGTTRKPFVKHSFTTLSDINIVTDADDL
jgi:hypothetical protein